MAKLIPVQYHRTRYPNDIAPRIAEVAGNFDSRKINVNMDYSLHTEYSFTKRRFDSDTVRKYQCICDAKKNWVPRLWYSREWALQFADFIKDLTKDIKHPKVIEIHPAFSDYTDLKLFMENYLSFYDRIRVYFPETEILIENRSGSRYNEECLY